MPRAFTSPFAPLKALRWKNLPLSLYTLVSDMCMHHSSSNPRHGSSHVPPQGHIVASPFIVRGDTWLENHRLINGLCERQYISFLTICPVMAQCPRSSLIDAHAESAELTEYCKWKPLSESHRVDVTEAIKTLNWINEMITLFWEFVGP